MNRDTEMHRLIYKSKSAAEVDQDTVRDIIEASRVNNREAEVTGALLATRTHFLQVLEGEFGAVNETFFRIVDDPRHEMVQLISFGPVVRRLFDDWIMKGFGIFNLNLGWEERLKLKYGEESGNLRFPTEEWAALALMADIRIMVDQ